MKINVIMTCFNRKQKTMYCINSLSASSHDLSFTIVDDGSTDGTYEAVDKMSIEKKLIRGDGHLFWAGGMRIGIEDCLKQIDDFDYVLLVNDDVAFYSGIIDRMVEDANNKPKTVIVGACCDSINQPTYGAIKLNSVFSKKMYRHLFTYESEVCADTFNCNAVLVPTKVMKQIGNFDAVYTHNFADYDYGFMIRKAGYFINTTSYYVGVCSDDKNGNTWENNNLPRKERTKLKELPKGLPQKEWNHFLLKNLGILYFIRYAYTAKIKIMLGL